MSRQGLCTPEQQKIIDWTGSLGAITAEALAQRLDITLASARARLANVCRRGLLVRSAPLASRPALFTLTHVGLRACDVRGVQICRVSPSNATHLTACAAVAATLERRYPQHRVAGERELRRDEREYGRPLASAQLGGFGSQRLHRPDLVMWPPDRDAEVPVAIEIELTVKAPHRLTDICRAWARARDIAGVLYFAPANVERALVRAIEAANAHEQIVVLPLDAAVEVRLG